ncbi:hypothetical protein [Amycolatopsis sp. NPDC051102]|uniref:hypothetical protein n=1 Tax=Amycolatopsis sp. NPDC051102 TaxID=3155163 RepID=UPI0034299A32
MPDLLHQLYRTKLRLAGLVTAIAGIGLLFAAQAVATTSTLSWLVAWPTNQLGTTLLSAGVIAVIFEYYARKESEALAAERFRAVIRQEAPAIRDAVLDSFAFDPTALKNIASPETLDRIAANALGLRLEDQALAQDVYADVRNQIIGAPERWHDVNVSVDLAPWTAGPTTGRGSMFVATLRWEYRVTPANSTMRFACVSDLAEYRDLLRDQATTSAWYFGQSSGLDAASRDAFELVQLAVNGKERTIRRTQRQGAQLYTAGLGTTAMSGEPVTVAYTYRVLVQRHGHLLYLDLPRPTKGLKVQFNYSEAGIRRVNTLDFIASSQQSRVEHSPEAVPARSVDIGFDGWIFPRSGVAFVWVLEEEMRGATAADPHRT